MGEESNSSINQIPDITDLQQSLSSLQVQDTQDAAVMIAAPMSPLGDPPTLQETATSPLLSHQPLPVSPSQVLPTPPPSSESSPLVLSTGKDTDHMTTTDIAGGLMLGWQCFEDDYPSFWLGGLVTSAGVSIKFEVGS